MSRAHAQTAGQVPAVRCSRFPSRESSRFHSREFGNEKVRESRAPGNENPSYKDMNFWPLYLSVDT